MPIVDADWAVDRLTKKFAYIGDDHGGASPSYATVIEAHRWLQLRAWEAVATGDDELDITNQNPSARSTDNIVTFTNGYTLQETGGTPASEHLYDGSIIEDSGNRIFDGFVNFGNGDVIIQVLQSGSILTDDWWNLASGLGANPDTGQGISHRWMMKTREDGVDIDGRRLIGTTRVFDDTDQKTFGEFKINGTNRGNNVFAITNEDDINNVSTATTVSGWTNITNTEGLNLIDVDGDTVNEQYSSQWTDDDTPDRSQNDFYERHKYITRDGTGETIHGMNGEEYRGITHSMPFSGTGYNPATNDTVVWGTYVDHGAVGTGPFVVGEAVHEDTATPVWKGRVISVDGTDTSLIIELTDGVIGNTEAFTGQTSGATATTAADPTEVVGAGSMVALAVDDLGATGFLYVQVKVGTAPGNTITLYDSTDHTASITTTSASTERTVKTPFTGQSTGSNIIGAYGLGIGTDDITNSDTLTALDGLQYSRPNLVTNTVAGLDIPGGGQNDYAFVAPWDGVTLDTNGNPVVEKDQLSLDTALTTDNITQVEVTESIPSWFPASGNIRVTDDLGFERRLHYQNWENGTPNRFYNIDTTDGNEDFLGNEAAATNDVYGTPIDLEATAAQHSFQGVHSTDIDLVAVVRNGGNDPIKEFITSWTFKANNQTLNAIRTSDT